MTGNYSVDCSPAAKDDLKSIEGIEGSNTAPPLTSRPRYRLKRKGGSCWRPLLFLVGLLAALPVSCDRLPVWHRCGASSGTHQNTSSADCGLVGTAGRRSGGNSGHHARPSVPPVSILDIHIAVSSERNTR